TETFSRKNINCTIGESLERFAPVVEAAKKQGMRVRGYISVVAGCPYEGEVRPAAVAALAGELYGMGCYEVSLGDTIGVGTPKKIRTVIEAVAREVPIAKNGRHHPYTHGPALPHTHPPLRGGLKILRTPV